MAHWFEDSKLHFAVGLEDTFVPQTRVGDRSLDEYELTQHYHHWHADLGLAKESGATMIRYGVPWYRVNPAPGTWAWDWLDRVVERLAELELEAIVDLMHYGTPLWLDNEFLNAGYPEAVAEYAGRVAERYRGALRVYTPLNEPLINAMHCGEYGLWPPYLRGHDGFVKLVRALVRGIVGTQRAVAEATGGEATFVHVEATFRYITDLEPIPDEMRLLRERQFLVEDLLTGRVGPDHALAGYLAQHGFGDDNLAWCAENLALPDVMGVNYYPAVSTERFVAGAGPSGDPANPRPRVDEWTDGLEEVIRWFAERYERPVFLTETGYPGTPEQRVAWLDASVDCARRLKADGVPIVGYTWWSLIDMMAWEYRQETRPPEDYLIGLGLWDLEPDAAGILRRVRSVAVDRYRQHATAAPMEAGR